MSDLQCPRLLTIFWNFNSQLLKFTILETLNTQFPLIYLFAFPFDSKLNDRDSTRNPQGKEHYKKCCLKKQLGEISRTGSKKHVGKEKIVRKQVPARGNTRTVIPATFARPNLAALWGSFSVRRAAVSQGRGRQKHQRATRQFRMIYIYERTAI